MTVSASLPSSAPPAGSLLPAGVIYAASGPERYAMLAARSAASFKRYNPGIPVDLYTDVPRDLPVFDRVHVLEDAWFRSRIDAMRISRFERTLMLDSDTMVVADIADVFGVLDRFDIALAHDYRPNGTLGFRFFRKQLPAAFPQFNGGVIAIRKNARTERFLLDWAQAVREHDIGRDQPALRETLWDSDLRIATLPEAYNLVQVENIGSWTWSDLAPRIVHSPHFHTHFDRYSRVPDPVAERLGPRLAWRMRMLRQSDGALAALEGRSPGRTGRAERLRGALWIAARLPGHALRALGRRLRRT